MGSIICDIVEITDESESYGRNVGGFSALAVIPFTFSRTVICRLHILCKIKKKCL